eukprot:m.48997 g.48997  ORF g.48997 m.48997 type:complete len:447 (+) comp13340_c0_seq1:65-1405(+)
MMAVKAALEVAVYAVALVSLVSSDASPPMPSLPNSYIATTSIQSQGPVRPFKASMLYSYPLQAMLLEQLSDDDDDDDTYSVRTLQRYDIGMTYTYQCYNATCAAPLCSSTSLGNAIIPGRLPPKAKFLGNGTLAGSAVEVWTYSDKATGTVFWKVATNGFTTDKHVELKEVTQTVGPAPFGVSTSYTFDSVVRVPEPLFSNDFEPPATCGPLPPIASTVVKGYARESRLGDELGNVTLAVLVEGQPQHTVTTDSQGAYAFKAKPLDSVTLILRDEQVYPVQKVFQVPNVSVVPVGTIADIVGVRTNIAATEMRVVLTWTEFPADLDSYLHTPTGCVVNYANRSCTSSTSQAGLARDVTAGYGPETLSVSSRDQETMVHAVKANVGAFTDGPTTVTLYNAKGQLDQMTVLPQGHSEEQWWTTWQLKPPNDFMRINQINTMPVFPTAS